MRRSIFLLIACLALAASAFAQVEESATGRRLKIYAGGEGSAFQPDYAGTGVAQTAPNRLYGYGAYVDFNFTRWVQVEAEARFLNLNQYLGISESSYMAGFRIPITQYKRATPYGKFMYGFGSGSFLTGRSAAFAYGGGLDYRLSKRFVLRAFEIEYQNWQVTPNLYPYGASVGLSYRVF
jgi:hypothetical protein